MIAEKIAVWLFRILMAFFFVFFVVFMGWAIPEHIERTSKAKEAIDVGCVYLGSARDLNSVHFYDCNGEIKMKRIK